MRIRIIFRLKNKGSVLPFHHQGLIRALLDLVMGAENPLEGRSFNFSGLKGQTKVGKDGLHYFSKRVTIVFSSLDQALIELLIKRLFTLPQVYLGNLLLEPEMVEREVISMPTDEYKYLCISPIILQKAEVLLRDKDFVAPTTDEFSDLLYESTMGRMEQSGLYTAEQISSFYKFQIVPDLEYIERLAKQGKKFARIYTVAERSKPREVRGYTFPFSLYAADEVQDFIFNNGFGEFTGHGFGMLDCCNAKEAHREVIFGNATAQEY